MATTAEDYYFEKHAQDSMMSKTLAEFMTQYIADLPGANWITTRTPTQYVDALKDSVLNVRSYSYAASDALLASDDTPETTTEEAYTKIKEIRIPGSVARSEFRIVFDMKRERAGGPSYAKIYRNGAGIGTERAEDDGVWTNYSEDITGWKEYDYIQIYGYQSATPGECNLRNFRIYGDVTVNYYAAALVW